MIYINDKEVNFIYNLGEKVKEVFSYGTKIWPPEVLFDYMYFKLADGYTSGNVSYQFDEYFNLHNKYLKISTDGRNWQDWTEQISMAPNVKYFVKGDDNYVRNSYAGALEFFTSDVSTQNFNIECGGNIMSLVNMNESITATGCFSGLFYNMRNLVTTPQLPAMSVPDYGYAVMFNNTKSLTSAPELPATTIGENAYRSMFYSSGINTAPNILPSTTLADGCYLSMFADCKNLTVAPELPATTLADHCYDGMFKLSGITEAPELPATTLSSYCYNGMFQNCTSLNKAPVLTATTLASNCYKNMFYGCTSLTEITLNGDFNSSYSNSWVRNVSTSGTFYNNSDLDIQVGVNGIPTGWTEIRPVKEDYMYFKLADGYTSGNVSYQFSEYYNLHNKYLKISTDGSNWSDWTEAISMSPNVKYFVKGDDNYVRNSDISGGFFSSDVSTQNFNIECGGNVMSLCNLATEINTNYCFRTLFQYMTNLVTPPKLPATTLSDYCYFGMFFGCSSLTQAPELPATIMKPYCYLSMFMGCKSLTVAPELQSTTLANSCYQNLLRGTSITTAPVLPATTLADDCYYSIFEDCSSLTQAPELPATTLAKECYRTMFIGCSSLTQAPELPATTLASNCYYGMFKNCTSLTKAPELPVTTLANNCYQYMFQNCTALTEAPSLPATTLANNCYYSMFYGCTALTQVPVLPATTLASNCYYGMFSGCSSLTQVPELPATTLASYCYKYMFQNCTALTEAPELTATTLSNNCYEYMFYNSNKLNWIKALFTTTPSTSYTKNWVNGVSSQGIFVKNINATWTTTGVNAVPTGWTVIYFDQTEGKYYTTQTKEVECDKYGNVKQEIDAMYFKLADGAESGNVSYQFSEYYNLHNKYLKISTDGSNWSDWNEQISMVPNVKYYVKGEDDYVRNSDISDGFFTSDFSTQNFILECGGNVMSLCNMATEITTNYCLNYLFKGMTNLVTAPELPATTLADYCYQYMFNGCTSLTQAPELPATTLTLGCYSSMFYGCSSLTQAPALPATTLTIGCYISMFSGCSSLTQVPALPATNLAGSCYEYMFKNCTALTEAPELPATTLTDNCYYSMFYGCTALTQAPALPATTLASHCYYGMFDGCSSLTQAPELPATTLKYYCYEYMFSDCSSLTQAPELPATTLTTNCYSNMFYNSNKLNWIKAMFITPPNINYTQSWVNGVSGSGVFVKSIDATWTNTGVNAVPTGWTVIYFDQTEGKYYTTNTKEVECDQYGNVKQEIDAMYFKLADGETSGNVSYKFDEYYNLHNKYLKYSTDGNNWQDWTEAISMEPTVKYYVKGEDDYVRNSNISGGFFTSDVSQNQFNIECGGNVMSLCNMATEITVSYCLRSLFHKMTNLVIAPKLPATTLAKGCYLSMFNSCTSLIEAPELPALNLVDACYNIMFYGCSSLNWIKVMCITPPNTQYTANWVKGVSVDGVFIQHIEEWWGVTSGDYAIPDGWLRLVCDPNDGKYYDTDVYEECDKYGNPLV